jgi:hypothetical protein
VEEETLAAEVVEARRKIFATAQRMLSGEISFIEGSRLIFMESFEAGLDNDPDILPFVGAHSETDSPPIDATDRSNWQKSALDALQPKIDEAENWAKAFVKSHCINLVERFRR